MLPFADDAPEQARFACAATPRTAETADLLDALSSLLLHAEELEGNLYEAQQRIAALEPRDEGDADEAPHGTP